jgi:hypothetical protein
LDEIYTYVSQIAPVEGSFELVEGFPPKPLSDFDKTVDQLKLQGSSLIQRLV